MKHIRLLFYLILSTLGINGSSYANETLKLSSLEGSINTEISRRVLAKAYHKLGIEIIVEELPPERSLHHSSLGLTDGELYRISGIETDHQELLKIPVIINELEATAFSKDKNISIQNWRNLKGYKIGIRRGIKFSERETIGMDVFIANENIHLFEALQADRVDIVVMHLTNGLQILSHDEFPQINPIYPTIQKYPLYHYINYNLIHLVPKLTETLELMESNGEILEIRENAISELIEKGRLPKEK